MDVLEKFARWLREEGRSDTTIQTYLGAIKNFQSYWEDSMGSDVPFENATTIDLQEYRQYLLNVAKGRNGGRMKPATANKKLEALRTFFSFLMAEEIIRKNPMDRVQLKRIQSRQTPKWLNRNERNALLRVIDDPGTWKNNDFHLAKNNAVIRLMLFAGLRVSETISLRIEDVKFQGWQNSGTIHLHSGKGGLFRYVPFGKDVGKSIRNWLDVRGVESDILFISQKKTPLTVQGVEHIFRKLRDKTKIESLTPHVLRHTYAKNLIDNGYTIDLVAELLGHRSLDTTRIYTAYSDEEKAKAVASLTGEEF